MGRRKLSAEAPDSAGVGHRPATRVANSRSKTGFPEGAFLAEIGGMKTWTPALATAALALTSASAWGVAAPEADIALPTAYLVYPSNNALDVSPDTRVFVAYVSAVELDGPNGERLPALLDPSAPSFTGGAYVPFDELSLGLWRVMAVPTPDTQNYAGDGVAIDLGTFTVGATPDDEAPWVDVTDAIWMTGSGGDDVQIQVSLGGQGVGEPVRYDIDLGDRDTLMDGVPEAGSAWTPGTSFTIPVGDTFSPIEPESASVRVRATDSSGNVGDWSDPITFDLVQAVSTSRGSCRAAPGGVGADGVWAFALSLVAVGLFFRRRAG